MMVKVEEYKVCIQITKVLLSISNMLAKKDPKDPTATIGVHNQGLIISDWRMNGGEENDGRTFILFKDDLLVRILKASNWRVYMKLEKVHRKVLQSKDNGKMKDPPHLPADNRTSTASS